MASDHLEHAPTGRWFFIGQMHFLRLPEGKISEHHMLRDDLRVMTQLGLFP
ncbi:MAG TPA: hypothetical protein VFS50_03705 [Meiothermus sp.]|nr:hypothetical protein [Meiothermus sp.]